VRLAQTKCFSISNRLDARKPALAHDCYATFMAKTHCQMNPASGMHIHHSVLDATTGKNHLFL